MSRITFDRRHIGLLVAFSLALGLVLSSGVTAGSAASGNTGPGTRVSWQGQASFLYGANVPWLNWGCDFGCAGNGGASSAASQAALDPVFGQARAAGMHTIRWWMFEGSPWQLTTDASGRPTGINPAVYTDIDAALALAAKHDLYYDFVLFSGPAAIPSSWMSDPTTRQMLATTLGQMFARYKANPRVLSWEVFNEPEWDIWNGKAVQTDVQATVKAIADSVHLNSPALVTVGSAMLDGLGMWVGQGLDYYQAHWYDYMSPGNWCALCTNYATVQATYALDRPLVIGEFYADTTASVNALQRFQDFYAKGYAGAWPWSLMPNSTSDKMAIDLAAGTAFAATHTDLGPTTSASAPTSTSTAVPPTKVPPTSTPTPVPPTPVPPTPIPPTSTPTSVPPTPVPSTPIVTAPGAITWTEKGSTSQSTVRRGSQVSVSATIKASAAATALVDIEIYDPSGAKVSQSYFDNSAFSASVSRTFKATFTVPKNAPTGTWIVKVGVFKPGWAGLFDWKDRLVTFTVK